MSGRLINANDGHLDGNKTKCGSYYSINSALINICVVFIFSSQRIFFYNFCFYFFLFIYMLIKEYALHNNIMFVLFNKIIRIFRLTITQLIISRVELYKKVCTVFIFFIFIYFLLFERDKHG